MPPASDTLEMAEALAAFHFPDDLWARVIYDLVLAVRRGEIETGTMVAALVPIYFGRVGSFVIENRQRDRRPTRRSAWSARPAQFELLKPYLVDRWLALDEAEAGAARRPGGPGAMSGEPLPSRILIPVANPLTAEELIRIGASLMEERTGELTALGIVEVPEGMPLSEGATRARQARRLLQRVLDYVPEGTVIHPLVRIGRHAAAGIVEAAAEQEADLMIFGWGGKSGPTGTPARRSSAPRSTRSCASRPATSPWSSSAAPGTSAGSWSRSAAARTRSWRCASRTRWPTGTAPRSSSCTSSPRASPRPCAPRPSGPSPRSRASS